MRPRALAVLAFAGCFSPNAATNVPCALDEAGARCPAGQVCVGQPGAEVCVPADQLGADASIDSPPDGFDPTDVDGDGVLDRDDNCPLDANPDQVNEDGDRFGDACDGCPPIADDTPDDADQDGVDNACDPHPDVAGDRIVMFESFDAGIPPAWTVAGTWASTADGVMTTVAAGETASLEPPIAPDASSTTSAAMIPLSPPGTASGIGIVAPVDTADSTGLACMLFTPLGGVGRRTGLVNTGTLAIIDSQAYAWTDGDPYVLREQHTGTSFTCEAVDPNGGTTSTTGTYDPAFTQPGIGVFTRSISVHVDWVMHVDSPEPP